MTIRNRWALVSLGLAALASSCASNGGDGHEQGDGSGMGAASGSGGGSGSSAAGASSFAGKAGGKGGPRDVPSRGGSPQGGDDGTTPEAGTSPARNRPISSCSTGTLFEGDPHYETDGDYGGWDPAGQDRFADPPIRTLGIAATGSQVYFDTSFEVWTLSGQQVRRVAGDEQGTPQYQPRGPCSDVQLIDMHGMAALPNGNVVLADSKGGGVIELADPSGDCTASPIAGNQSAILESELEAGKTARQGDRNGPGAQAQFHGIRLLTSDEDGDIYGDDSGNGKIKKIAGDVERSVSTLYDYPGADMPNLRAMTAFGGKLYVAVGTTTDDVLWAIDTQTGAKKDLYKGRGIFAEIDPQHTANISGLTNDGEALIATSSKGYVWRISTAGQPGPALAGMGAITDYPEDLDLTRPVPVAELPLKGIAVNRSAIAMWGQHVLWGGRGALGLGFHVLDISCE